SASRTGTPRASRTSSAKTTSSKFS
ncbi:MAG: hypothetical protein AVDCRST_MAG42-3278, partial [uncultured Chthoniobacterales bacterium]